jgi:hypothetical protein
MRHLEDLMVRELEDRERQRYVRDGMARIWDSTMDAMRWPVTIIGSIGILAILFIAAVTLFGCHDGCDVDDTRCAGSVVQECASDKDWYNVEDCEAVGGGDFECCEVALVWDGAETAGCVLVGTCDAGVD